jgi:hypothetical protein
MRDISDTARLTLSSVSASPAHLPLAQILGPVSPHQDLVEGQCTSNPFAVLLARLSGIVPPAKACQGYQQYMRELYTKEIALVVEIR